MSGQRALFTGLEQRPPQAEPRGFRYREEIISEEEQAVLVTAIEKLDLKPFEFHGYLGNRRVASFGFKYDFSRRAVQRADDIPHFLNELLGRVAEFAGSEQDTFRQAGINEYRAGAVGFAGRTKEIGSGYLTHWSRVLSTSFLEKLEQNGNTVSLHSTRCDIRLPSARSRIRSFLKRDDNHGDPLQEQLRVQTLGTNPNFR